MSYNLDYEIDSKYFCTWVLTILVGLNDLFGANNKFMYFDNINGGWFSEEVKSCEVTKEFTSMVWVKWAFN